MIFNFTGSSLAIVLIFTALSFGTFAMSLPYIFMTELTEDDLHNDKI